MNKEDLIGKVSFVLGDGHKELQLYGFVTGDDTPYRISISPELETELIGMVATGVRLLLVEKEYEIVSFATADERQDRYYLYDLDEIPERMIQMKYVIGNHNIDSFDLKKHPVTEINTLILTLSDGDSHAFSIFKVLSSVEKVVKTSNLVLAKIGIGDTILKEETSPLLKIGPRFQIVFADDSFVFLESSSIEKNFKLHQILQNEAARNIDVIQNTHLLKDVTKLQHYAKKTAFSRKLVSVMRSSKVIKLKLSKDQVFAFIANDEKLRTQLKMEIIDGEQFIDIRNIESAQSFLDLLNDEFLHSKLTGLDYQAPDKDER